jgi:hypothetical protein
MRASEKKTKLAADRLSLLAEKRQQAIPGVVSWLLPIAATTPEEEFLLAMFEWDCGDMGQVTRVFDPKQDWTGGDYKVAVKVCNQIANLVKIKQATPDRVSIYYVTQTKEKDNEEAHWKECDKQLVLLRDWIRKKLDWDRNPRKRAAALLLMAGGRVPDVYSPVSTYLESGEIPPTERELYDLLHEYPQFTDIKLQVCRSFKLNRFMEKYDRKQVQSAVAQWQLRARVFVAAELGDGKNPAMLVTPAFLALLDEAELTMEEDTPDE